MGADALRAEFGLAQSLLHPASAEPPLPPAVEEELVIAASREFYDNAESGNLHKGDMKLAFDWCVAFLVLAQPK